MQEILESLYVINKHARKYAQKAHEHYLADRHAPAARNSARKEALYDLKGRVLSGLTGHAERIERHRIDGKEYLCLYINGFAFHALPDEIDLGSAQVDEAVEELSGFEKTAEKEGTSRTLKVSLLYLQEEFGISANDLLPKREASYAHRTSFNGWKYLEEGLMDEPIWKQSRAEAMDKMMEAANQQDTDTSDRSPRGIPPRDQIEY